MKIGGSHTEYHVKLNPTEKASKVTIFAGVKDLKAQYTIDREVLGKGAFGEVYKAVDKKNPEF